MSSGLSILIIVILIAIIAAIATVVILNKYFNHQIAELDALTDELKDISVEEDIKRLEKMELAGKSLETFKRWQKVYQKVDTKDVGELKHLLEKAAGLNAKFNLIKTFILILYSIFFNKMNERIISKDRYEQVFNTDTSTSDDMARFLLDVYLQDVRDVDNLKPIIKHLMLLNYIKPLRNVAHIKNL